MEKTITGKTPLKRMTKLTSFALPAVMAFTLAMPAFTQSAIKAANRRNPESKGSADSTADMVVEEAMVWNG